MIFLYTLTINCVITVTRNMPIDYNLFYLYRIMYKKHFVAQKMLKIIPNNTIPTFQEVGWVTQPHIFC